MDYRKYERRMSVKSYKRKVLAFFWCAFRAGDERCWFFHRLLFCELAGCCVKAFNRIEPMYCFFI